MGVLIQEGDSELLIRLSEACLAFNPPTIRLVFHIRAMDSKDQDDLPSFPWFIFVMLAQPTYSVQLLVLKLFRKFSH